MLCILYVNVVTAMLGAVGLLAERTLASNRPRRWIWCCLIVMSVVIPPVYRAQHVAPIARTPSAGGDHLHAHSTAAMSPSVVGPGLWERAESYDPVIHRVWWISSRALLLWGGVSALWVAAVVIISRRRRGRLEGPAVVDGVPVIVTRSMGPATVGLGRSRVLIPRWVLALPGVQRRYVVQHEEEHRRAFDAQLLFLTAMPLVLLPWNLPLWWLLWRLRLAVEMDCDDRVVAALGDAPAYGELLLKVAEASSRGPRLQPAFLGSVGMLERRLRRLLVPARRGSIQRFLAPALAAALLVGALLLPHPVLEERFEPPTPELPASDAAPSAPQPRTAP